MTASALYSTIEPPPGVTARVGPAGDAELSTAQFVPSELTRGPWRPDAQHGGPPAALLGHLTHATIEPREFVAFIEVELTRPVPLEPLTARVTRHRTSRRVSRIHAALRAGDVEVCRSDALVLVGADPLPPPSAPPRPSTPPARPASASPRPAGSDDDAVSFHRDAVEHRFVSGAFETPGPAVDWARLKVPVVEGTTPTGLERVLATADFGSGISSIYRFADGVGLINANIALTCTRVADGEWISLDSETTVGPQGTGTCITRIGDAVGPVAVATQSLLVTTVRAAEPSAESSAGPRP